MTATLIKDLWACPVMPVKTFGETLGLTTAATKKFLDAANARVVVLGGIDWVFPQEIGHNARAWK